VLNCLYFLTAGLHRASHRCSCANSYTTRSLAHIIAFLLQIATPLLSQIAFGRYRERKAEKKMVARVLADVKGTVLPSSPLLHHH
jgi:hypothetical protein